MSPYTSQRLRMLKFLFEVFGEDEISQKLESLLVGAPKLELNQSIYRREKDINNSKLFK